MKAFLVANPKGGSGKSTLATNLAGYFASKRHEVMLGDIDRQQSSREWLGIRPFELPSIDTWEVGADNISRPPKGATHVVLDTPAGLHGKPLKKILSEVDRVVVPVSPSRFDMLASQDFFEELAQIKAVRKDKIGIAIVGMRVDFRTNSSQQLIEFLQEFELPLLTGIRSAQGYVRAIDTGTTLFDISNPSSTDIDQWRPLLDWLVSRR